MLSQACSNLTSFAVVCGATLVEKQFGATLAGFFHLTR